MSLIKDIYSPAFYDKFSDTVIRVVPSFNKKKFIAEIFNEDFKTKEWKDRMKHTTRVFHDVLSVDFPQAIRHIARIIAQLKKENFGEDSLAFIFFPDYIESYGQDDFEHSVKAFEQITQFVSCEFAVRPFILKYGQKMIGQMTLWSEHENYKVRRLASEGSRPRLPWAMALPELKKNPTPILPLLENMKNDPSEWVRRSVANNLNDIARDHPDVVIEIAAKWRGLSRETDAIIKHGCRTLLKQGHAEVLKQYGLESKNLELADFKIITPTVKIGDSLEFAFSVRNTNPAPHTVRLEYGIYYKKSKGHLAKKVFKISERLYAAGEQIQIQRKQPFKLITTRTFHTGGHQLSIILNGEEKELLNFELIP